MIPELGKIYQGDCLAFMKTMDDKCVDLVFTSPPYNIARKRNDVSNRPMYNRLSNEWYDDHMEREDYLKWQKEILTECIRICRGSVFYNHKIIYAMSSEGSIYHPWDIVKDFFPKCEITWDRCGGLHAGHQRVIVVDEKIYQIGNPAHWDGQQGLTNIWRFPPAQFEGHPCAFPVELPMRAINLTTKEGMIVFDPFMGSGTTGLAAERTGRKWVGCEINPEYIKLASDRIALESSQGKLF